eukprot:6183244-Pleurochrysis_carterae.AAC.1
MTTSVIHCTLVGTPGILVEGECRPGCIAVGRCIRQELGALQSVPLPLSQSVPFASAWQKFSEGMCRV